MEFGKATTDGAATTAAIPLANAAKIGRLGQAESIEPLDHGGPIGGLVNCSGSCCQQDSSWI